MSEAIVFISHFRVRPGKLEGLEQITRDGAVRLEAEKPRTVVFLAYLDEARTRVDIVHVFPDAESMDAHFEGAEERSRAAYEFVEPDGWEIYGRPSERALDMMRRFAAASGVRLTVLPIPLAGFLRPGSSSSSPTRA